MQGFVWREAREDDLVCVTPAVRDQVYADNAAADQRRNSVKLTLDAYFAGNLWRHRVDVTNINVGQAYVGFFNGSGDPHHGLVREHEPGGGRREPELRHQPPGLQRRATTAYFRVKDMTSTRWSQRVYVKSADPS